jgi:hypothetical protein
MNKNHYYAKSFPDSAFENNFALSAAAAKEYRDNVNAAIAAIEWARQNKLQRKVVSSAKAAKKK